MEHTSKVEMEVRDLLPRLYRVMRELEVELMLDAQRQPMFTVQIAQVSWS